MAIRRYRRSATTRTGILTSQRDIRAAGSSLAMHDGLGNAWSGGNGSVTMFNEVGGSQSFTGGGIATPTSIAIAGDGSVWIANTNNTLANLTNNGIWRSSPDSRLQRRRSEHADRDGDR